MWTLAGLGARPNPANVHVRGDQEDGMGRVQLALNVDDIDEAVDFYRRLFGAEPAKRRPGYANFAVADPPLKLVLIENPGVRRHAQPPRGRGRVDG